MRIAILTWLLLLFTGIQLPAQEKTVTNRQEESYPYRLENYKRSKLGAIILTVLTGPLGGHRVYLGSRPIVPIVYTLTLGGGMGLLPLIDLIRMIFSPDLKALENRDEIILLPGKKKN